MTLLSPTLLCKHTALSLSKMPPTPQKRKQPPTFHHFPENRAKQLKKAWVEKTKIKSKWKAQKRKEGLIPSYPVKDVSEDDHPTTRDSVSESDSDNSHNQSDAEEYPSDAAVVVSPPRTTLPLPRRAQQEEQKRKPRYDGRHSKVLPQARNRNQPPEEEGEKPSIRELFQTAYSKSSLHTFKADPLKRRQGGQETRGGRGRGRGAAPSRGRGQPNMKLRMNAMLEKIKQDYS